ncbi:MAG: RNA pseudouridine synthase [Spirochaetaceae bacterium]|jgi:23S rRNA pseudouridine1911/1915/1917 synthase|nr:RNA pseudouridine synthase [Spirochaetaceae bacterium]
MKKQLFWTIIAHDENIVAVNKASGISITGDRWSPTKERLDTLLAAELGLERLFVVHRIDNGSSGLVVFAKTAAMHRTLSLAFERREVEKRYLAIVHGRPAWQETCCDLPLLSDATKRHETIVEKFRGKKARTRFKFLAAAGNYSVLTAWPETGRQHQIRVHLARLGHPIVCDELYGTSRPVYLSSFKKAWRGDQSTERPLLGRLGLHAQSLVLPAYPQGLTAPPPKDMAAFIYQIEKCSGIQPHCQ